MRKRSPWSVAMAGLAVVLGCSSEPLDACGDTGTLRQPFTNKCLQRSLDAVTDPSAPDYGSVPCRLLWSFAAGAPECACDASGFAPLDAELREVAAARYYRDGHCASACCESVCFCELLQLVGDELAACQSRPSSGTYDQGPSGWCYVEPALGLGVDEDVATCRPTEKRLIRYFPGERSDISAVLACIGDP